MPLKVLFCWIAIAVSALAIWFNAPVVSNKNDDIIPEVLCSQSQICLVDSDCGGGPAACIGIGETKCRLDLCTNRQALQLYRKKIYGDFIPCRNDKDCANLVGSCNESSGMCDCDKAWKNTKILCNETNCAYDFLACGGLQCRTGYCDCNYYNEVDQVAKQKCNPTTRCAYRSCSSSVPRVCLGRISLVGNCPCMGKVISRAQPEALWLMNTTDKYDDIDGGNLTIGENATKWSDFVLTTKKDDDDGTYTTAATTITRNIEKSSSADNDKHSLLFDMFVQRINISKCVPSMPCFNNGQCDITKDGSSYCSKAYLTTDTGKIPVLKKSPCQDTFWEYWGVPGACACEKCVHGRACGGNVDCGNLQDSCVNGFCDCRKTWNITNSGNIDFVDVCTKSGSCDTGDLKACMGLPCRPGFCVCKDRTLYPDCPHGESCLLFWSNKCGRGICKKTCAINFIVGECDCTVVNNN